MYAYIDIATQLADQGYAIIEGFLEQAELSALDSACHPITDSYGLRQVLASYPAITRALPANKLTRLLQACNMQGALPVRSLFFNKNTNHNWLVPWHQDKSICVNQKVDIPGYGKWTRKNEVYHVEPPTDILDDMLTLRFALDDSTIETGALKLIAGSHKLGKLDTSQLEKELGKSAPTVCEMRAGDILLMRPLLLHASDKARQARQRRVLHLEMSKSPLPHPMQWAELNSESALFLPASKERL